MKSNLLLGLLLCTSTSHAWGPSTIEIKNERAEEVIVLFEATPFGFTETSDPQIQLLPNMSNTLASGATTVYHLSAQPTDPNTTLNVTVIENTSEREECLFSMISAAADTAFHHHHPARRDYRTFIGGLNCSAHSSRKKLTLTFYQKNKHIII